MIATVGIFLSYTEVFNGSRIKHKYITMDYSEDTTVHTSYTLAPKKFESLHKTLSRDFPAPIFLDIDLFDSVLSRTTLSHRKFKIWQ